MSNRTCDVEGCDSPMQARGLCNRHYAHKKRYGVAARPRKEASLPGEEWRPIPRWEGFYEASNLGRIRSVDREVTGGWGKPRTAPGKVLRQQPNDRSYAHVILKRESKSTKRGVHRLVCMAFYGVPASHMHVNHIDGDPSNNRVENLEWCDASHNMLHSYRTGLNSSEGEKNSQAKLTADKVRAIRRLAGSHSCASIARRYGISHSSVSMIVARKRWGHVDD